MKQALTDDQVEREIARLLNDDAVKLAKYEEKVRCRRRQYLYQLRTYEAKGKKLMAAGITEDIIDQMYNDND